MRIDGRPPAGGKLADQEPLLVDFRFLLLHIAAGASALPGAAMPIVVITSVPVR